MATTLRMLRRFPHLFVHSNSRISRAVIGYSTDTSGNQTENDEPEDFFGIPSDFQLQQKRLGHLDIEQQYFGTSDIKSNKKDGLDLDIISPKQHPHSPKTLERDGIQPVKISKEPSSNDGDNIFDEQYFGGAVELEDHSRPGMNSRIESNQKTAQARVSSPKEDNSNFIEDQYFGDSKTGHDMNNLADIYLSSNESKPFNEVQYSTPRLNTKMLDVSVHKTIKNPANTKTSHFDSPRSRNHADQHSVYKNEKDLVTAYDMALKVRQEMKSQKNSVFDSKDKLSLDSSAITSNFVDEDSKVTGIGKKRDSKGYRILSDQLLDLRKMTSSDIVTMLRRKIVFDHEDFLAIDKPYGLPSVDHNDERLSLTELLPKLCKSLPSKYKASDLHLVQGLDKDVTGAVILAKNEEAAYLLQGMFNSNEIIQRFWAITKGVPNPPAGLIDIPIGQAKVGNHYKMVLRPLYSKDVQFKKRTSRASSFEAVTEFKVLASHQEAALVECQPQKKLLRHQLRVHLANGLNTPVLGDHKYSHFSKLAPQKLNRSTLELLDVRQAKVRHLALHLHCNALVIPHYKSYKMIFITTKLPPHFARNMKSLKLFMPRR